MTFDYILFKIGPRRHHLVTVAAANTKYKEYAQNPINAQM